MSQNCLKRRRPTRQAQNRGEAPSPAALRADDLSPRAGRGEKAHAFSRRALPRTRVLPAHDPEKWSPVFGPDHAQLKCARTNERAFPMREAERRKARSLCRACASSGAPLGLRSSRRAPLLADALASRRSTAALAKASRLWLSPVPRFMAAPTDETSVRHPGSQLLADLRRGRPGEFPNRPRTECMAPPAGTALAPSRGVPSAERPLTNSERGGKACSTFGDVVKGKGTMIERCLRAPISASFAEITGINLRNGEDPFPLQRRIAGCRRGPVPL